MYITLAIHSILCPNQKHPWLVVSSVCHDVSILFNYISMENTTEHSMYLITICSLIDLEIISHLSCETHTVKSLITAHLSRQSNCWSLRCSWSIACRRCSNYIFILNLAPGCNGLGKDNCKTRRETMMFGDRLRLMLEIWRYVWAIFILTSASRSQISLKKTTRRHDLVVGDECKN